MGVLYAAGEGSGAGAAAEASKTDQTASKSEIQGDEFDSDATCEFGARLCQKNAKDWARAQLNDATVNVVMACMANGTASNDIPEEGLGPGVDVQEVKRLVFRGDLLELPSSDKNLVRCPSRAPAARPNRNSVQYQRLLGDEPVRTDVPIFLRPWVMNCTHTEAVHLSEKVTLVLLQRCYWWIGMAESVKWWMSPCFTWQTHKSTRQTVCWPLMSLPLPSRPGKMVYFDRLGPLPTTARGNLYVFLVVDLFSRHANMP